MRCGRTAAGWRPHGCWLPNSKLDSVAIVYSGIKKKTLLAKISDPVNWEVSSDTQLWTDCTKCPQTFYAVRDIILTVSELQFYIRSRQVTTLHAVSYYCMICIYSPLQCQEGDCRTLACDVVFSRGGELGVLRVREHPLNKVHPLIAKSTPSKWKENLMKHRFKQISNKVMVVLTFILGSYLCKTAVIYHFALNWTATSGKAPPRVSTILHLWCSVPSFSDWWVVRLHGDMPDSRHPAVSCQSYRTWRRRRPVTDRLCNFWVNTCTLKHTAVFSHWVYWV